MVLFLTGTLELWVLVDLPVGGNFRFPCARTRMMIGRLALPIRLNVLTRVNMLPLVLIHWQLSLNVTNRPGLFPLLAVCRWVSALHTLLRLLVTDTLPLPMTTTRPLFRLVVPPSFLNVTVESSELLLTMVTIPCTLSLLLTLFARLWSPVRLYVRETDALARLSMNRLRVDLLGPAKFAIELRRVGLRHVLVWFASTPRMQSRRDMLNMTRL